MGSADFGIPALEKIIEAGHSIAGIVSTPAKGKGRGLKPCDSPVTEFARKKGLMPIITPVSLKTVEFIDSLKAIGADLFVVVAFRILPREIFTMPAYGTINIHASLLPKYRGPAPIQRAIEAGETKSGVTIFRIDEGIDTGNILLQKEADIGQKETTPQLYERLSMLGAEGIVEAINVMAGSNAVYSRQDSSCATPAPKLVKAEGNIDWCLSAIAIYNKIRAFKPFPGIYTFLNSSRLGIEWAEPVDSNKISIPGTICSADSSGIVVKCGQGALRILEVKPEGKKAMSAAAFIAGRKIEPGTILSIK